MNVLNIHQKDEQYTHPCSSQVRVQKWRLLRVWGRLGLGFGDGQVRVKWRLFQGQDIVYNGVVLSCLSFSPFMVFECTQNLQALLVVKNHSFMIVAFEAYNLCNLLLVNTIVPFHEPRSFHFLLVFKLFPIFQTNYQKGDKVFYVFPLNQKKKEEFWRHIKRWPFKI